MDKESPNNENWKIINEITLDLGSEENAEIFYNAFTPELDYMPMKRSDMKITKNGSKINLSVKSLDITAFRASINSILQFTNVVDTIIDYIENPTQ